MWQRLQRQLKRRIGENRVSLRRAFDQFDVDRSGSLEMRELGPLMEALRVPRVRDDRALLAGELDLDGDGVISFPEFESWLLRQDAGGACSRNQDLKLGRMWNLAQHVGLRRRREQRAARKIAGQRDRAAEARTAELREQEEWQQGGKGALWEGKYVKLR